jgi:hypothetical protein
MLNRREAGPPMLVDQRVRLCLRDLYSQDIVEMIERETRRYELHSIEHPSHPDFERAYGILWDAFGPQGEMEPIDAVRGFLTDDAFEPVSSGTYIRYFMLAAKDREGNLRGVRDGSVLYNPAYSPDLCLVYLSHIFMLPEARGTVLTYWLRIAPVELAMQYLRELAQRRLISLPAPDAPDRNYGMRLNLAAEMEYFSPEDRLSLQRILFYGRGGFDVIDPRHFPYRQPDFRDPAKIRETGNTPVPFMLLLRRVGRERQARLPLDEAAATMRLLYDDFAFFCQPEFLANSLDVVTSRLEDRRARGKEHVDLLPLPTGPMNLQRLKRLFRYTVYQRHYAGEPGTRAYMESGIAERIAANPKWFDEQLASLAQDLEKRTPYVYGSRGRDPAWVAALGNDGNPARDDDASGDGLGERSLERDDDGAPAPEPASRAPR